MNKEFGEGEIENIDSSDAGLLFSLPILPLDGNSLKIATDATVSIFKKHGFEAYITFNILDSKSIESVINLAFNKANNENSDKAKEAIDELNLYFMDQGFILYRTDIDRMSHVIDEKDQFWQTVKELKNTFDPNNIIAPGRYNIL